MLYGRSGEGMMRLMRAVPLCGLIGAVLFAAPAVAGCRDHAWDGAWRAHQAITDMENRIAFLEADPKLGHKGPFIEALHRKILRLHAAIGPRRLRWSRPSSPCCYSRRPIYIR
jgi:hypothetical protein